MNGYIPLSHHVCLFRRTNGLALRKRGNIILINDLGGDRRLLVGDLYFSIQKLWLSNLNGIPRVMIQSTTTLDLFNLLVCVHNPPDHSI